MRDSISLASGLRLAVKIPALKLNIKLLKKEISCNLRGVGDVLLV